MKDNKTKLNLRDVTSFINDVEDLDRKSDSIYLLEMMKDISGDEPMMWGDSIIGFGQYRYTYASGRSGDWFRIGFSPRKQNLTIYLNYGFEEDAELMKKLGKYKTGKACLYIKKLTDVDLATLRKLMTNAMERKFGI